jgi:uncharacterized protein YecA (UPF0149 family)
MSKDPIANRFEAKQKHEKLDELARKGRTAEELEAEEKLIKETPKTEPIKGEAKPNRNDPCPCGSGKKYKKCCGGKA